MGGGGGGTFFAVHALSSRYTKKVCFLTSSSYPCDVSDDVKIIHPVYKEMRQTVRELMMAE